MGVPVKVGDLDLTVVAVRPFNSKPYNQFNDSDTAVDVQITNARGDSYDFNAFLGMKLIDTNGVAHEPELACADCPNEIQDVKLVRGGHAEGTVYFKLGGAVPKEIDYQSVFSTNKVAIPVSPAQ